MMHPGGAKRYLEIAIVGPRHAWRIDSWRSLGTLAAAAIGYRNLVSHKQELFIGIATRLARPRTLGRLGSWRSSYVGVFAAGTLTAGARVRGASSIHFAAPRGRPRDRGRGERKACHRVAVHARVRLRLTKRAGLSVQARSRCRNIECSLCATPGDHTG